MKKLFTYLLGFLMTFLSYACTDNNVEDAPAPAILELDHPSVNIAPDGGTTSVIVYSNYDWELSGGSSWCRPSTTSGKANTEGQEVSFSASSTYESRETTFWFSFADKKISLVVYQEQQDALIADGSNTFTIPAKGGTVVIEYKTNVDCQIVIPESAKNWLTVTSTRSFDSKKATLKVTENTTYSARCAKIKVVSSDDRSLYTEYTINQEQNDEILVDGDNVKVPASGGSFDIDYLSNVDCEVIIPKDAQNWISIAPATRSLEAHSITFNVGHNNTFDARYAAISIKSESLSRDIQVEQSGIDKKLSLSQTEYELSFNEANIEVDVDSNIDYSIAIPKECDWVSINTQGNVSKEKVVFNISENPTIYNREAVIVFQGEGLASELHIVQKGDEGVLSLNDEYTAQGKDTILKIEFQSNFEYKVSIPQDCDWVSIPGTRAAIENHAIELTLLPNPTLDDRSVNIVFSDIKGDVSKSVKITQMGCELGELYQSANNEILYISTDGKKITPASATFGNVYILQNTYQNGIGKITYSGNITKFGDNVFKDCTTLKQIIIPSSVQEIGATAFYGCTDLISVTIPDSVTSIGESAFYGCSSLTSATIGSNVASIGVSAFCNCSSLSCISIPDKITVIGGGAFSGCDSLTRVYISDLSAWCKIVYDNISANPLSKAGNLYLNNIKVTKLTIPSDVTRINSYAFCNCNCLTDITISNKVTSIEDLAFYGCNNVTNVIIGNKVTSIGASAFYGCSSLISITIPDLVTSIGDSAFYGCNNVTNVIIGNKVTSIGASAFYGCSSLTNFTIPNKITSIEDGVFCNCSSLTSITIPESVTYIGDTAFSGCSSLKSVTIPNSITSIGGSAFSGCTGELIINSKIIEKDCTSYNYPMYNSASWLYGSKFTGLIIGDNITKIGKYTFYNCSSLTSVTIPDSITSIGSDTFYGCPNLTRVDISDLSAWCNIDFKKSNSNPLCQGGKLFINSVEATNITIPDNVTSIGNYAFCGCGSITSITIPDDVTLIGVGAFRSCRNLASITIPEGVTSIGGSAFYYCKSLTSVTIPDSVTSIGEEAFNDCWNLTSVTIGKGLTAIKEKAFYNCGSLKRVDITDLSAWCNIDFKKLNSNPLCQGGKLFINGVEATNITIPDNVTSIGNYAFCGCSSLTSVTIPNSVVNIGVEAFRGCNNITSTIIGMSVANIKDKAFYNCSKLNIVYCNALTPPTIGNEIFSICAGDLQIYVLDYMVDSYKEAWGQYSSKILAGMSASDILPAIYYTTLDNKPIDVNIENINTHTYDENGGKITINSSVITTIPEKAFFNCNTLTSVTIPDTVTSIGASAFSGCSSLKSVTIPDSVTSIGDLAFYGCSSLKSVTIPNSVTSIGDYAFKNCSSLTSITIPNSVTSIGSNTFYGCSSLTSATIPEGVTSIGGLAFSDCESLTSITIPDTVTSIGNKAFYGCSSLTSVTIGDSVASIGAAAFYNCNRLTSITIPNSVTSIGDFVFYGCSSLTSATIGDSVASIGKYVFYDCKSLTSITIPDSVTDIGYDAFYNCAGELIINSKIIETNYSSIDYPNNSSGWLYGSKFTKITIGDNITSIGDWAFYGCSSLTSATIGDSVASIGASAFSGCSSLKSVTIPNSVTSIGYRTFYYCTSLTSVTIPDSVTSIGAQAFYGCSSLTSITIPDSVTDIGYDAFYNCAGELIINSKIIETNYSSIDYPSSGRGWLYGSKFTKITIGDNITSIGDWAFSGCSSLTSATIGDSVASIGASAFYKCNITSITIPNSVTSIGDWAFSGCSSLTSATIGDSVASIGASAFKNCSSLTSITIPNSVTYIGENAFYGCSLLNAIYCKPKTPPTGNMSMFANNASGLKIYVPRNSVEAYKSASYWSNYSSNIEGYDF